MSAYQDGGAPPRGAVRFRDLASRDNFIRDAFPTRRTTDTPGLYEFDGPPPADGLTGAGWLAVRYLEVEWSQDDRRG